MHKRSRPQYMLLEENLDDIAKSHKKAEDSLLVSVA